MKSHPILAPFCLSLLGLALGGGLVAPGRAAAFSRESLALAASAKATVSPKAYPGLNNPNPKGWYYKCANVVLAKDGSLVACWQLSDNHTSLTSWIMVSRSNDGGRSWSIPQVISHRDVWADFAIWVVPQMGVLRDGRIAIICDEGQRNPGQDMPMLSDWQKPNRGMANWIFWSADNGQTWTKGEKIDAVGGEPGYPVELSDGTLAFTRTTSRPTEALMSPPLPWGKIYYRNDIVFSDDAGKSWPRSASLADNPFFGDCEVGLTELAPGRLMAVSRIGLGNGRFGHPSRLLFSDDNGKTWPVARLAPFYGQRPHIGRLQSGKYLVTYRNVWGTPGSRALVFDPQRDTGFQPTSYLLDESRCVLEGDELRLSTTEGKRSAVEFNLYPAQDDVARVEVNAELRVKSAEKDAVAISAGCWVRVLPERVELADRPTDGFAIDAANWHRYRIIREKGWISIAVDGVERLRAPTAGIWVREVRFGNRANTRSAAEPYGANAGVSEWRSVSASVHNDPRDYSIDWKWVPAEGYPDQFRRDRTVVLDYAYPADCGYSSWTQMPDGRIVIVDYTNGGALESYSWDPTGSAPFIRSYTVTEAALTRR